MNQYENNYLAHYGVKGMKWGHRKKSNSKSQSVGRRAGLAVGKQIKKVSDKVKEHDKKIQRRTDMWGTGGVVIGGHIGRTIRKQSRSTIAHVLNTAANAYISGSNGSYRVKRGVDFVRQSAITGLSVADNIDQISYYRDIYNSAVYKHNKYRR